MVDTVFSYGEPGFQEFRTGEYLTGILAKNGFKITKGVAAYRRPGPRPGARAVR